MDTQDHNTRIKRLEHVVFGDEATNEKGMKEKIDEMYDILVQAKGWKSLALIIVLVGGVIAVFKSVFIK